MRRNDGLGRTDEPTDSLEWLEMNITKDGAQTAQPAATDQLSINHSV